MYRVNGSGTAYKVWGIISMVLSIITAICYTASAVILLKTQDFVENFSSRIAGNMTIYIVLYALICLLLVTLQFLSGLFLARERVKSAEVFTGFGAWFIVATLGWTCCIILLMAAGSFVSKLFGNYTEQYFTHMIIVCLIRMIYDVVTACMLFSKKGKLIADMGEEFLGYDQSYDMADNYQNQDYLGQGYDNQGYDNQGFDNQEYDNQGYNNQGVDNQGFDNQGYNNQGYDDQGYNNQSYDNQGYNNLNYDNPGENGQGYNNQSYDNPGNNSQEYNNQSYNNPGNNSQDFGGQGSEELGRQIQGYLSEVGETVPVEPAGKIVGLFGVFQGQEYPMENGSRCVVGRAPGCDIILDHSKVSRIHCTIRRTEKGTYKVTDSSSNGTYHENDKLERGTAKELPSGSLLVIGDPDNVLQII